MIRSWCDGETKYPVQLSSFLALLLLLANVPNLLVAQDTNSPTSSPIFLTQSYSCGKTCGKVRSCEEAVYQWCVCGYKRADGDNDGVPCEKHCGQSSRTSLARVKSFKKQFGCR
ncbi:excalibur calcium-binding domain-containing protein [Sulfitobacter mediterraneus]|uniref:excalibur calcium-binding domain-containing protein n=1 Tax=Sulfitobacter mediterraneus TaxID=83219 RepID=UPI000EA3BA10|nr:excalibur calcium-binding domain-containing protein [Sulfitobacter mediterraneus]